MEGKITLAYLHQLWLNEGVHLPVLNRTMEFDLIYIISPAICSYNFKIQAQVHPKPIRFLKIQAQHRPMGGPTHGPWVDPAHDEHCC